MALRFGEDAAAPELVITANEVTSKRVGMGTALVIHHQSGRLKDLAGALGIKSEFLEEFLEHGVRAAQAGVTIVNRRHWPDEVDGFVRILYPPAQVLRRCNAGYDHIRVDSGASLGKHQVHVFLDELRHLLRIVFALRTADRVPVLVGLEGQELDAVFYFRTDTVEPVVFYQLPERELDRAKEAPNRGLHVPVKSVIEGTGIGKRPALS